MRAFSGSRKGWAGVWATSGRNSSVVAMASRRHSSASASGVDPLLEGRGLECPEAGELTLFGMNPCGVRAEVPRRPEARELTHFEGAPAQWAGERAISELIA